MIIGIIGGTGLGEAFGQDQPGEQVNVDTPFGRPSSPILRTEWQGVPILIVQRHGPGHVHPPSAVPFRANVYALKKLGVTHVLASGAVGSLRDEIRPRDLVIPDQVIDKTHKRPSTFFDEGVAVHVEFAEPFCPTLRRVLCESAEDVECTVHPRGTYVCMEGPAFSTRAESNLHRAWGGDLIGMTCMPEAKLAREAEICYATVALATDYDCWRPHQAQSNESLLKEVLANLRAATDNAIALLQAAVRRLAANPPEPCRCQQALALAVWSNKGQVAEPVRQRLDALLGRYFS